MPNYFFGADFTIVKDCEVKGKVRNDCVVKVALKVNEYAKKEHSNIGCNI